MVVNAGRDFMYHAVLELHVLYIIHMMYII